MTWLAGLLALVAGAITCLAFAPFALYPLAILGPALLFWLWRDSPARHAGLYGLLYGVGLFTPGIYWIYISLHVYGNAPPAFAALATGLVILLMAAYPAMLGMLLARWWPRGHSRWWCAIPAGWALFEWLRSWLFTGFPWLALGYSQIDSLLAGWSPLLGVFGLGFITALSAGLLLLALDAAGRKRTIALLGLVGLWGGGFALQALPWTTPQGDPLRVSLVQGNISQDVKFDPASFEQTLERYVSMSLEEDDRDLIVWPETAIPALYEDLSPAFRANLQQLATERQVDFLIGVPSGSWDDGIFRNSVMAVGSDPGFYHKHRLLPFGEYLPLRGLLSFFEDFVEIPMADFTPGAADQSLLRVAGQPVGVSICFEAVFGTEIRRSLPGARLLVNLSNDAWFGDSSAPYQHLEIARMRSLEAGRPMARATNTGVSALIDAQGQVLTTSELFSTETVRGELQPHTGSTPYVRFGNYPALLLAVLLLIGGGLGRRLLPP